MTTYSFQLQPFPGSLAPALSITGVVTRDRQQLSIIYLVTGPIDQIQLPPPNPQPIRQWELWETTCFECFMGPIGAPNYWEFNLAPNGNWNAFALTNYREGIVNESQIELLTISTDRPVDDRQPTAGDRFTLATTIPLNGIIPARQTLEMSVTAVIQSQDQSISYWAIAHCGSDADFHRRDSFELRL